MRRVLVLLLLLAGPLPSQAQEGWTPAEREIWWNSPVGSRLVPYAWFLALERPGDSAPFAEPGHLATYGFLPGRANPINPDGLPIGLARERGRNEPPWLGMSCSACHTRRLSVAGQELVIDGAGAALDPRRFDAALTEALARTAAEPERLARFTARLKLPDAERDEVKPQLDRLVAQRRAASALAASPHPAGPGRMDLRGILANLLAAGALDQPGNARPPAAPVRMPHLWNGTDPAPLQRYIAQVLASGGTVRLDEGPPYGGSPSLPDLIKIGALLRRLRPPPWPAALPPIDPARAERGRTVFERECAGCHAGRAGELPVPVSVATLGTDRAAFAPRPAVRTGVLRGRPALPGQPPFGAEAPPDLVVAHVAAGLGAQLPRLPQAPPPLPRPDAVPAPSLAGIWARAPFLHNGSVPSLWLLLSPDADRPRRFSLAPAEYDPNDVGLPVAAETEPLFDAALPGNAATGHLYGATLPEPVRRDLLEYLKGL